MEDLSPPVLTVQMVLVTRRMGTSLKLSQSETQNDKTDQAVVFQE